MLYLFCTKFRSLSDSEIIVKLRLVLAKLQLVKPAAFFGTQCIYVE